MYPVCMRKSPSQPQKIYNLYYLLYTYLIEIFIFQYIGTLGTDVIAPPIIFGIVLDYFHVLRLHEHFSHPHFPYF